MAIAPVCDFCANELTEYGGLLFSPPNAESMTEKSHICAACYERIIAQKKNPA